MLRIRALYDVIFFFYHSIWVKRRLRRILPGNHRRIFFWAVTLGIELHIYELWIVHLKQMSCFTLSIHNLSFDTYDKRSEILNLKFSWKSLWRAEDLIWEFYVNNLFLKLAEIYLSVYMNFLEKIFDHITSFVLKTFGTMNCIQVLL